MVFQLVAQYFFCHMTEGWMTEIMRQTCSFSYIRIQPYILGYIFFLAFKFLGNASSDLPNFFAMGQSIVKKPYFLNSCYLSNTC